MVSSSRIDHPTILLKIADEAKVTSRCDSEAPLTNVGFAPWFQTTRSIEATVSARDLPLSSSIGLPHSWDLCVEVTGDDHKDARAPCASLQSIQEVLERMSGKIRGPVTAINTRASNLDPPIPVIGWADGINRRIAQHRNGRPTRQIRVPVVTILDQEPIRFRHQ